MSTRADKLRAMAEHPRSNPHEAAVARAELERLLASTPVESAEQKHVRETEELLIRHGCPPDIARAGSAAHWARVARRARGVFSPDDPGYREWAGGRSVGETVMVSGHEGGAWWEPGRRAVSRKVTIERVTATQYVMTDGTRFRRTGYRVGEDGRSGRTYLMAVGQ